MCLAGAWSTLRASSKSLRLSFRELLVGCDVTRRGAGFCLVCVLLKNAAGGEKRIRLGSSGADKNENKK